MIEVVVGALVRGARRGRHARAATLLCRADLGTARLAAWLDDLPPLVHPDVRAAVVRVLAGG